MREGFPGGLVSKKSNCSEGDSGEDDPAKPGGRLVEHWHRLDWRLTGYVGLSICLVYPLDYFFTGKIRRLKHMTTKFFLGIINVVGFSFHNDIPLGFDLLRKAELIGFEDLWQFSSVIWGALLPWGPGILYFHPELSQRSRVFTETFLKWKHVQRILLWGEKYKVIF